MPATLNPPQPVSMPTTAGTPASLSPAGLFPRPLGWDLKQFHNAGDAGLFEGHRAMLIDGVILEQGPMNPPHATALSLATEVLRGIFQTGWFVRGQFPLNIGQRTDPLPD